MDLGDRFHCPGQRARRPAERIVMAFPDGGWADAPTAAHLQQALRRHCVINQAVGIVMAQRQRTSAQAREMLRSAARDRGLTLCEVCTDLIVGCGRPPRDPPDPSPPGPRPSP